MISLEGNLGNVSFIRNSGDDGATQRNFVYIFELSSKGYPPGNGTDFKPVVLNFFIQVKYGGISLHGSTEGKNNFLYLAALNPFNQLVDSKISGTDPVHRRN